MIKEVNVETIKKLIRNYERTKKIWDYFISQIKDRDEKERFFLNFHIRTTTNYLRLVCTHPALPMRTAKIKYSENYNEIFYKALKLLKDNIDGQKLGSKEEVNSKYGFNIYENNKKIKEYDIQALFIRELKEYDMSLLASEFNIFSGGRQRVDIVAKRNNEIWVVEVKHNDIKTKSEEQVNEYKEIFNKYRQEIFELLKNATHSHVESADYIIKTAVVYSKGLKRDNVDKIWKYKDNKFIVEK